MTFVNVRGSHERSSCRPLRSMQRFSFAFVFSHLIILSSIRRIDCCVWLVEGHLERKGWRSCWMEPTCLPSQATEWIFHQVCRRHTCVLVGGLLSPPVLHFLNTNIIRKNDAGLVEGEVCTEMEASGSTKGCCQRAGESSPGRSAPMVSQCCSSAFWCHMKGRLRALGTSCV